jgi:hypothetical protein
MNAVLQKIYTALLCGQIVLGIAEGQDLYELLIEFSSAVGKNKQH